MGQQGDNIPASAGLPADQTCEKKPRRKEEEQPVAKSAVPDREETNALRRAIGEDLRLLGFLHAGELDKKALDELKSLPFAQRLGIVLSGERAGEALRILDAGLSGTSDEKPDEAAFLEELACDYTGIYLTNQCGVSPCESPWRDEDRLACQQPMFEVREWYGKYGLAVADWRKRPDDHLATQLAFAGHLMAETDIELEETGRFLDQHLLLWVDGFARKVAGRCATPFYAGLAVLTSVYLQEIRDMIEALTGLARPPLEEPDEKDRKDREDLPAEPASQGFVPGNGGPGW